MVDKLMRFLEEVVRKQPLKNHAGYQPSQTEASSSVYGRLDSMANTAAFTTGLTEFMPV